MKTKISWEELNNITIYQWIRLGICFGLWRWMDYAIKNIIASRAIEKVLTIYQMAIIEKENTNISFTPLVKQYYAGSLIFESIFIIIIGYGLWMVFVWKFGLPKKLWTSKKSIKDSVDSWPYNEK
jgi:hypothetical protein